MKIREWFVSNSSSSSFAIVYAKPDKPQAGITRALGEWLDSGMDYFILDGEMVDVINLMKNAFNINLRYAPKSIELIDVVEADEFECEINARELPTDKKLFVRGVEIDYHCTQNVDEFVERYCSQYISLVDYKSFRDGLGCSAARSLELALLKNKEENSGKR